MSAGDKSRSVPATVSYELDLRHGPFSFYNGEERVEFTTRNAVPVIVRVVTMSGRIMGAEIVAVIGSVTGSGTAEFMRFLEFVKSDGAISLGRCLQ